MRPNIVLICADQWRGDCLSACGHPVVHTPYLDDLCLNGCRFDAAYSAVPSCIAARASLFTGQTPRTHGRVGYRDGVPWNYDTYLAGEFTRHGYQSQAVGKMHVYPERSQCGFQNVVLHDGFLHFARKHGGGHLEALDDYIPWLRQRTGDPAADYFDHGLNCNSFAARPWDKAEELHPTHFVVTQGIDFLRRRDPRKPFFLFLSFHRPHPPLDPPRWAFEQYLDCDMPDPPVGDWAAQFDPWHQDCRSDLLAGRPRADVLRRARAGYYGSMTHIDHQINRFLESLVDHGAGDNTTVCFTSDHGELLGDHHLFRKSLPYEGSARVPLVFRGAGIPKGRASSVPAELRDVMPTLLSLAGLPVPPSVEGEDLTPAMLGGTEGFKPWIHGEHGYQGQAVHWLTDGRRKYVWFSGSGREQFFDLERDPHELHDLATEAPPALAPWRQNLVAELTDREEGFTDGSHRIPGRPTTPVLRHVLG